MTVYLQGRAYGLSHGAHRAVCVCVCVRRSSFYLDTGVAQWSSIAIHVVLSLRHSRMVIEVRSLDIPRAQSGVPSAHLIQMSYVSSMFHDDGKGIVARWCPLVSDGAEDKVLDAARR